MRRSTVYKANVKKMPRVKRKDSMKINPSKLQKFCHLWSMDTPPEVIQKELNIKQAQYYRYIDAAEEIVDDFLLGMVDHGLVLLFKTTLERVKQRQELFDLAIESTKKTVDKNPLDFVKCLRSADEHDKLYSEMLDDIKIVNQAVKTLNKVIMNNSQDKK